MVFSNELVALAETVLTDSRNASRRIVTAESCTGGLIAGLLTEIPGSSDVFERGFVTYANEAKEELLGVPHETLLKFGAVSEETARAMVLGALSHSRANLAVAVTGIAGPGGEADGKPVGLVHITAASGETMRHLECRFGDIGRSEVRLKTVEAALNQLKAMLR
jgi:nicotinamide-nucleotide amidase